MGKKFSERNKECPNCHSKPGEACTQPTDTGRRPVAWVHLSRLVEVKEKKA